MRINRKPLTPAQRGQIGGLTTATRHDGRAVTEKARAAYRDSFADQIRAQFPDLSDAEIQRRAEAARKLHYVRLAHKSAETRRSKAAKRRASQHQQKGGADE